MIKEIHTFNTQVLGVKRPNPQFLNKMEYEWLIDALEEEINELTEAYNTGNLVGCIDSVLDLSYFAVGACVRMGLTVDQIERCFAAIHNANMNKKLGVKETRANDGSVADAIKPSDWKSPEEAIEDIIDEG